MNSKQTEDIHRNRGVGVFIFIFFKCIVLMLSTLPVFGHRLITFSPEDGKLHNLPTEFQPAAFNLETATLSIAGKELALPETISTLLPKEIDIASQANDISGNDSLRNQLQFTASWSHGPSLLPPYIQILIRPNNENFSVTILIDIERMLIIRSHIAITSSNNQDLLFPISISTMVVEAPDDWRIIIGLWRRNDVTVKITEERIEATMGEEMLDYPNGKINYAQPGKMMLTTSSGIIEPFLYVINDDVLQLTFERAPDVSLARIGSKADRLARERLETEFEGPIE